MQRARKYVLKACIYGRGTSIGVCSHLARDAMAPSQLVVKASVVCPNVAKAIVPDTEFFLSYPSYHEYPSTKVVCKQCSLRAKELTFA